MVKVKYSHRILCDRFFLDWLLAQQKARKHELLRRLMMIKASSKDHCKIHNVILDEEYNHPDLKKMIQENVKIIDNIKGAVKSLPSPDFLKDEKDNYSRNIRFAVRLTHTRPYNAVIFTSKPHVEAYLKNSHFINLTGSVIIKSDEEAALLIDTYYRSFESEREE